MRTLVSAVAWLATRAGAEVDGPGGAAREQVAGEPTADKAGRLVAVPDETPQQVTAPSLESYWALGAAAILILILLASGYVWRHLARRGRLVWSRSSRRK